MVNRRVETFRDLVVWQKSHELVIMIYKLTGKFPKRERESFASQIREIATLVPVNIATGFKKRAKKAKVFYYRSALTTIEKIRYMIILAEELGYIKSTSSQLEACDTVEKMLKRLIRSITTS
jgi:four helix bundle protein